MIPHLLKKAFDPIYEVPIDVWERFYELCTEVRYKKNEVIKPHQSIARHGYFLLAGAVGSFIWKKNTFACLDFYLEGAFFADEYSLFSGRVSDIQLIAIEDTHALQISKDNIEILKETPIGKTLFLEGEQVDNVRKEKQKIDLMTMSAEERYLELLNNRTDIINRIPQKHIASYLGVTQQSLSRIRRKIADNSGGGYSTH